MTVSEQAKQFGAKVKRKEAGWYTYIGKNFTLAFNQEEQEYTWWETDYYISDNPKVYDFFKDCNRFDTKNDCVYHLLYLDQELENQ